MTKSQLKAGQFTLKQKEITQLIDGAQSFRNRVLIRILSETGLRREETVSIEIKNIDFERRRLRIIGKGQKERIIPLNAGLLTDIKFLIGNTKNIYLFPAKNRPKNHLHPIQVNRIVAAAGKEAGLTNPNPKLKTINPHSLRHSFVRRLKDKGVPLEVIQNLVGHASFKTTMDTYGLITIDDIQEKFNEVFA